MIENVSMTRLGGGSSKSLKLNSPRTGGLIHRSQSPATGETVQIKAKRVVKFRVAKAAKDAILGTK